MIIAFIVLIAVVLGLFAFMASGLDRLTKDVAWLHCWDANRVEQCRRIEDRLDALEAAEGSRSKQIAEIASDFNGHDKRMDLIVSRLAVLDADGRTTALLAQSDGESGE